MCILEIRTYVFSDHGRSTREKLVFCAQSDGENACSTVVRNHKGDIRLADLDLDDLHEQLARETQARHQRVPSSLPHDTAQRAYGPDELALMMRPKPFVEILETRVRADTERPSYSPLRKVSNPYELALMVRPKPFFEILKTSRKRSTQRSSPPPSPDRVFISGAYFELLTTSTKRSTQRSSPPPSRGRDFLSDAFSPGYFKTFFVEEGELGRGGRGVVLLVRHVLDGVNLGHFACKRIPIGDDHEWLGEILNGIRSTKTLSHLNLVSQRHVWLEDFTIHRFGPSVHCAFILQQYCNGGTLQDYILGIQNPMTKEQLKEQIRRRSKGLPKQKLYANKPDMQINQILSFLDDITSGLHHLHSHGYAHGNLKPTNCLLNNSGQNQRVLVNDFGLKTVDPSQYHAPEILRESMSKGTPSYHSLTSDMFSLGMILHLMCFKRLPYGSAVAYEEYIDYDLLLEETTNWGTSNYQFESRKDLPATLLSLLKRLLSFEQAKRPTTIEVLESINSILTNLTEGPSSPVSSDLPETKIAMQCDGCKKDFVPLPDTDNLNGTFFCSECRQILGNADRAIASARQTTDAPHPIPMNHKGKSKAANKSGAQNQQPKMQSTLSTNGSSRFQESVAIEDSKRQLPFCRATLNKTPDAIAIECGIDVDREAIQEDPPIRLTVVNYLGHGSLGIVEEVRVTNKNTNTFVRKRVLIPYSHRRQRLEIIQQEARMLKALIHPHIVKMIGSYRDVSAAGRYFYSLLMSPVGDNDLKTLLDKTAERQSGEHESNSSLDIFTVRMWLKTWFGCLASALAYMHGQRVRHQDIKPSNIIHRRGNIYFTDFSSSTQFQLGQTTSTEAPARTSAMYGAPEVIFDHNSGYYQRHGLASDVFSLGCVFVEMLTVLSGKAVHDFHNYCLEKTFQVHSETQRDQGEDSGKVRLLYTRVLDQIDDWFDVDHSSEISSMYVSCVKPMLVNSRQARPQAATVLKLTQSKQPWQTLACPCQEGE